MKFLFVLFLLICNINGYAQDEEGKQVLKEFFIKENTGYKKIQLKHYPYSADFDDEGDPYSVEYEFLGYQDLDGDAINDLVFNRISSGQLGANIHSNSSIMWYLLNAKKEIKQSYEVLTYAPFSYNILDDISFKNGKVYAKALKNFRTYFNDENRDDSSLLVFEFKDSLLYEHSYLTKCKMAEMKDKHIFKPILTNVKSIPTIDEHNYVTGMSETYINNVVRYDASLNGCDNLTLSLSSERKGSIKNEQQFIMENLTFFIENTRYKTVLTRVMEYVKTKTVIKNKFYTLDNHWQFRIDIGKRREGKTNFDLMVEKTDNENQSENWEITTRRK